MKKLLSWVGLAFVAWLLLSGGAWAQQVTNPCTKVGQTSCAQVTATAPLPVTPTASVSNAASNYTLIAAATTNSTLVKSSAGAIYEISLGNNSSTPAYIKFYNKATAPTCGTDTPVAVYLIRGETGSTNGSEFSINLTVGKGFSTGIGFCITGGIANNDTTAVSANTYNINLTYR